MKHADARIGSDGLLRSNSPVEEANRQDQPAKGALGVDYARTCGQKMAHRTPNSSACQEQRFLLLGLR